MWGRRFFAGRYFAPRYFAQSQGDAPDAPTARFYATGLTTTRSISLRIS